jgi:AGZA family xanthine/uracil permease-like MFS transporter
MGLNAYFTYQVVGFHGQGPVSYRLALTAVFIEGLVFVFLSLIGMRQWLVKIIPSSIKVASGVGIGLFLTETGLSYSGIGLITRGSKTPTDLGGCPRDQFFAQQGHCGGHRMTSPTVCYLSFRAEATLTLTQLWIGIVFGGVFTAYLMAYRVKSAIIAGILLVSIISWP